MSLRMLIVVLSASLFVVSLTQDAVYTQHRNPADGAFSSIILLVLGFMGPVDQKIAWFANPALFAGWRASQRERPDIRLLVGFPVLALLLSLSFLVHDGMMINEGGRRAEIIGYGSGYWLWVSSSGVLVLGNVLLVALSRSR